MNLVVSKTGKVLKGRLYELYTGNCPPERPCPPQLIAKYREMYDSPQSNVPPSSSPGTKKLLLWKWMGQAMSYLEALARWKMAGSPVPSKEELAYREQQCHTCPQWDSQRDGCRVCSCGVDGGSLAEKRKMATERCPDELPRWLNLV